MKSPDIGLGHFLDIVTASPKTSSQKGRFFSARVPGSTQALRVWADALYACIDTWRIFPSFSLSMIITHLISPHLKQKSYHKKTLNLLAICFLSSHGGWSSRLLFSGAFVACLWQCTSGYTCSSCSCCIRGQNYKTTGGDGWYR